VITDRDGEQAVRVGDFVAYSPRAPNCMKHATKPSWPTPPLCRVRATDVRRPLNGLYK
jgi:hypothetical protein